MDNAKKNPVKLRKWGRGSNPLILKRTPRRSPEPPEPPAERRPGLPDYSRERANFARVKWDLIAKYPGQFMVFVDDEMIGPFADFPLALKTAYETFGRRPILAKELIPDDSVR